MNEACLLIEIPIRLGLKKKLYLGNLDSFRDWGHSKDYIRAMHLILKHNKPDDFVIATGQTRSIRQLCKVVFDNLNLDYRNVTVLLRGRL